MRNRLLLSLSCLALLAGCSKPKKTAGSAEKKPVRQIDACSLLTSGEIETLQGEALKETIPSAPGGDLYTVAQCYFTLPNNVNSIVLTVTQRGKGPTAKDPREYWEQTFGEKGEKHEPGEEGEKRRPPLKVEGLGDEAFWLANAVGGALYVLKDNMYLRVSTGGTDELERSKRIAQTVLPKL
ncbi:MAG: hypothetical protein M3Y69_07345 [Verrucomicrobiota bacterium]|nr:hypothetical protein [Verrucomicrobiota bacterium]